LNSTAINLSNNRTIILRTVLPLSFQRLIPSLEFDQAQEVNL
jgi:hypothetical protein